MSKYLGLEPVKSIAVTVPVNFILVGFARDGNFNVELTEDEIRKWRALVAGHRAWAAPSPPDLSTPRGPR